jgi:hypothetical protein
VRVDSILTSIRLRDHRRDHLVLTPCEREVR